MRFRTNAMPLALAAVLPAATAAAQLGRPLPPRPNVWASSAPVRSGPVVPPPLTSNDHSAVQIVQALQSLVIQLPQAALIDALQASGSAWSAIAGALQGAGVPLKAIGAAANAKGVPAGELAPAWIAGGSSPAQIAQALHAAKYKPAAIALALKAGKVAPAEVAIALKGAGIKRAEIIGSLRPIQS